MRTTRSATAGVLAPEGSNGSAQRARPFGTVGAPIQRWITFGLLLTAAVALAACSQEDYYCDADGCYVCDGVGCRRMSPPGRTRCVGDCDCGGGMVCHTVGCAATCTAPSDCARGTVCSEGFCLAPRESGSPTGACAPCPETPCGAGLSCVGGVCRPPANPACDATRPCSAPEVCVDGECREPEEVCQFNAECGMGRICVNQRCTTECDASRLCPSGSSCDNGFCIEDVPPVTDCNETTNRCASGQICIEGACWTACGASAPCGAGRYCGPDGRCRYDDRPQPTCGEGRPCIAPAECVQGVCRSPCASATDCRRFDEQLTFCGRDMYCYTTNEATSNCNDQTDCSEPERCIDGTCR